MCDTNTASYTLTPCVTPFPYPILKSSSFVDAFYFAKALNSLWYGGECPFRGHVVDFAGLYLSCNSIEGACDRTPVPEIYGRIAYIAYRAFRGVPSSIVPLPTVGKRKPRTKAGPEKLGALLRPQRRTPGKGIIFPVATSQSGCLGGNCASSRNNLSSQ